MAEGGKVWCEDPQKVPRKIPARAVHGAEIRNSGKLGGKVSTEDEDKKDAKTVGVMFESVVAHYPDSTGFDSSADTARCSLLLPLTTGALCYRCM